MQLSEKHRCRNKLHRKSGRRRCETNFLPLVYFDEDMVCIPWQQSSKSSRFLQFLFEIFKCGLIKWRKNSEYSIEKNTFLHVECVCGVWYEVLTILLCHKNVSDICTKKSSCKNPSETVRASFCIKNVIGLLFRELCLMLWDGLSPTFWRNDIYQHPDHCYDNWHSFEFSP